ncbi:TlpA family protein disulfide reductase [Sphingobacterium tabacisoli]|uniref:TlpA family protein disulfide reductase n=1 Tax=Sphingobacterium tabacisoli TaxID=2044855 RepID=A0ABW5L7H4_9SPHI|nr:TlpA disulfide reductase family protein [Sphingobacterium tabacisoli]
MKGYSMICLLVWFGYTLTIGQSKSIDRSWQLVVGESVPEITAMPIVNWEQSEIDLGNYKDKVVVLEFFDTYCATCIEGMPHLQRIQQQMRQKLLVLMVTWQSKEVIEKFYRDNRFLKENNVKLPTVVADTLMRKYFPHQGVPHTVFLYKGKVQAITYPDYVKERFIEELYNTGKLAVPQKDDFREKVRMLEEGSDMVGSVKITGYQESLEEKPGLTIESDSVSGFYKTYFYNVGILNAYKAMLAYIKKPTFILTEQRILWKVKDPSKYRYQEGTGGSHIWLTQYGISYERRSTVVGDLSDQAKLVLNDLNSLLGLSVYWDTLEMNCLIIRKTGKKVRSKDTVKTGKKIDNIGILTFLMDYSGDYPPVIDESGFKGHLEIGSYSNIKELNDQLSYYGLEVVSGRRSVEVLVVEEK